MKSTFVRNPENFYLQCCTWLLLPECWIFLSFRFTFLLQLSEFLHFKSRQLSQKERKKKWEVHKQLLCWCLDNEAVRIQICRNFFHVRQKMLWRNQIMSSALCWINFLFCFEEVLLKFSRELNRKKALAGSHQINKLVLHTFTAPSKILHPFTTFQPFLSVWQSFKTFLIS